MPHRLDNLRSQRELAGYTLDDLARRSACSDWLIRQLEVGGTCDVEEAQRIADALSVSLSTLGDAEI